MLLDYTKQTGVFMSYNKQILQLEVEHYDITKDGTTLIEISIRNYKEILCCFILEEKMIRQAVQFLNK